MKMILLSDLDGDCVYVNAAQIALILSTDEGSRLFMSGIEGSLVVSESPDDIIRQIVVNYD